MLVPKMINVERKSSALSMKDATSEILVEDKTASPFDTKRMILIAKLTVKRTCQQQIIRVQGN